MITIWIKLKASAASPLQRGLEDFRGSKHEFICNSQSFGKIGNVARWYIAIYLLSLAFLLCHKNTMKTRSKAQVEADSVSVVDTTNRENDNEQTMETLGAMLRQELQYKTSHVDSLATRYLRKKVFRMMLQVAEAEYLQRETAVIGISYLDRYMNSRTKEAKRAAVDPDQYRLAALVCLYVATKVNESDVFSASGISRLSKGKYSVDDIVTCESYLLEALKWLLHCPTPHQYIHHLVVLLPRNGAMRSTIMPALYADCYREIELIVGSSTSVSFNPSEIAIKALFKCLDVSQPNLISSEEKVEFVRLVSQTMDALPHAGICKSLFRCQ